MRRKRCPASTTTCNTIMAMAVTCCDSMNAKIDGDIFPTTNPSHVPNMPPTHHRAPEFYQSWRKVLVMEGLHLKCDSKRNLVLASCIRRQPSSAGCLQSLHPLPKKWKCRVFPAASCQCRAYRRKISTLILTPPARGICSWCYICGYYNNK